MNWNFSPGITSCLHKGAFYPGLASPNQKLRARIEDEGIGIREKEYSGLTSIRGQLGLLGGKMENKARLAGRTLVEITIPMMNQKGKMSPTVFLADDHAIIRDGLRALLKGDEFQVVGEASKGPEVLEKVQQLKPDILILDITLPGLSGIDVTRQILALMPDLRIIILSMHSENHIIVTALQAGARAYLVKDTAFEELYVAIREVLKGRRYISREVASTVLDDLLNQAPAYQESPLTQREREILRMIAEGIASKDIGMCLNLSERTVESHRTRIMDKLDLHSIAALTRYAIRIGLISLED